LARLRADLRRRTLGAIHLTVRAINALNRDRISCIGDLIDRAQVGFSAPPAAGRLSVKDIQQALLALSASIQPDGSVDWVAYAQHRKFLILPAGEIIGRVSPRQLLDKFPEVAGAAVKSRYGPAAGIVFYKYVVRRAADSQTLTGIGRKLGYTKQAVALLKNKVVLLLRSTILEDDYTGCRFRFRAQFISPLRELAEAMAGQDRSVRYSRWTDVLRKTWALRPDELGGLESLILELLGYQIRHPSGRRHEPIVGATRRATSNLTAALRMTERLLKMEFPAGLSILELAETLHACGQPEVDCQELREFVKTIPGIDRKSTRLNSSHSH